jgi:hypothetical protein
MHAFGDYLRYPLDDSEEMIEKMDRLRAVITRLNDTKQRYHVMADVMPLRNNRHRIAEQDVFRCHLLGDDDDDWSIVTYYVYLDDLAEATYLRLRYGLNLR